MQSTPAFLRKTHVAVQISLTAPFFRSLSWNNTDIGGRIRNHLRASLPFCPVFLKAVTNFWCKTETIILGELLPDANTNLSEADGAFCFKTGIAQLWDFCWGNFPSTQRLKKKNNCVRNSSALLTLCFYYKT